jgi:chromosome segregation ATPase
MEQAIVKLLEYQALDMRMFDLRKSIENNVDKEIFDKAEMVRMIAEETELIEVKAGQCVEAFEKIEKTYSGVKRTAKILTSSDPCDLSDEELEAVNEKLDGILAVLSKFEKRLLKLQKSSDDMMKKFHKKIKEFKKALKELAAICPEFKPSIARMNEADDKYEEMQEIREKIQLKQRACRINYKQFCKKTEAELERLRSDAIEIETELPQKLLRAYGILCTAWKDSAFAVVVPSSSVGTFEGGGSGVQADNAGEGYIVSDERQRIIYIE